MFDKSQLWLLLCWFAAPEYISLQSVGCILQRIHHPGRKAAVSLPRHLQHPGDPEGQLQLQRRNQPAQPTGRKCWISTSSAALVTSLSHQDLLTFLILFHGCLSPPGDSFVTRISADFIVSWQKCLIELSGQWLQEEYKQKCGGI